MDINTILSSTNIADALDENTLKEISKRVTDGYKADVESCGEYHQLLDRWTAIALQLTDKKTFPWNGAANVKFPLLATAAMQFAARAYPSLVPSNGQVVKCRTLGPDPDGSKQERASRVGKYLSYQVMDEMSEWEDDMDKLLMILPITGTAFKKTFWDKQKERNVSKLVMPKNLIVNYWTQNIDDAERVTEVLQMSKRVVKEKQLAGLFVDVPLGDPQVNENAKDNVNKLKVPELDETTPYSILEQHTYLDLDGDDYEEPYIVTFEEKSEKILRIVARFSEEGITTDKDGNIIKIVPDNYYTKFEFVPNPDGGFYAVGFGRLLGPINESADTLINQLIDAGTLSNLQAGFIGKGLRISIKDSRFTPGEWKVVNATGDDIKKQVFPLPTRDPSPVLMQLVQFLLNAGKELASVAEIFVGKMPGQNTPATTTMAAVEQGMKVFTAVYKRIFRSLTEEFRKLYLLNKTYLNPDTQVDMLDFQIGPDDFKGPHSSIVPAADPSAVSAQEKQQKIQAVMQLLPLGTVDPMEATKLYLDAFEIPHAEQLMRQPPPPPPNPEEQKAALEQQQTMNDMQAQNAKIQLQTADQKQKQELRANEANQKLRGMALEGALKLQQSADMHNQKMTQMRQQSQVKKSNKETH